MRQISIKLLVWLHAALVLAAIGGAAFGYMHVEKVSGYAPLLLLIVPVVLSDLAVHKVKNIFGIILCLIFCLALANILPVGKIGRVALNVMTVAAVWWRFSSRTLGEINALEAPSYYMMILFAGLGIIGMAMKNTMYQTLITFAGCTDLLITFIYQHRQRVDEYCINNQRLYRFPGARILGGSRAASFAVCAAAAAGMILFWLLQPQRLVFILIEMLRQLLVWLFSHVKNEPTEAPELPADLPLDFQVTEGDKENSILSLIWAVLEILLILALIIAAAALILRLIWMIYHRYTANIQENGDKLEAINPFESAERLRREPRPKRQTGEGIGSPNQVVRRIYKKEMKKRGNTPEPWHTPEQIEESAGILDDEVRREFHMLYEKARYSPDGCSRQDSARMRQLKPQRREKQTKSEGQK